MIEWTIDDDGEKECDIVIISKIDMAMVYWKKYIKGDMNNVNSGECFLKLSLPPRISNATFNSEIALCN